MEEALMTQKEDDFFSFAIRRHQSSLYPVSRRPLMIYNSNFAESCLGDLVRQEMSFQNN